MTTVLRDYQAAAVAEISAARERRVLLVAPTGSGKSVIAAKLIHDAGDRPVLFFVHRRELVHQARNHLANVGIHAGAILAGEPTEPMWPVQVASVQTLHARCIRSGHGLPPAAFVFVDEGHHCPAESYRAIIEAYPEAKVIGMTATPVRRDGRGLGSIFERLIQCPQVPELIRLGHLVPTKVYAPALPDLKGVRTRAGDYVESELAAAVDKPTLVGDIPTHWHRHAGRCKTVVFAASVDHSIHIRDEFIRSGVHGPHTSTAARRKLSGMTPSRGLPVAS